MATAKEKCWSKCHQIITSYNDHNDTPLSNVKIREAINQIILEYRVISEADTITVDTFMVSLQINESEDLINKFANLKINIGNENNLIDKVGNKNDIIDKVATMIINDVGNNLN